MKKRPWIVSFLMQEDGETKCKKLHDLVCDEVIEDDPLGWPEDDLDEWEW